MIEEAAVPFNGTEFNLTCTVTVDKSVDTEVNISTQWLLPSDKENTISNVPERVSQLEQLHYLTFRPLRSEDSGSYICDATVRPTNGDFVKQSTASNYSLLVVRSKFRTKLRFETVFLHVIFCRVTSSRC